MGGWWSVLPVLGPLEPKQPEISSVRSFKIPKIQICPEKVDSKPNNAAIMSKPEKSTLNKVPMQKWVQHYSL